MRSVLSRNSALVSDGPALAPIGRPSSVVPRASDPLVRRRVSLVEGDMSDWRGMSHTFDPIVIATAWYRTRSRSMTGVARGRPRFAYSALAASSFSMFACQTWRRWPKLSPCGHARSWTLTWIRFAARRAKRHGCCGAPPRPTNRICSALTCVCSMTGSTDGADPASRHRVSAGEPELLFLSTGFEIAQQYGDYRFVRVDRMSPYVVTVARRPRRSGHRPDVHNRHGAFTMAASCAGRLMSGSRRGDFR